MRNVTARPSPFDVELPWQLEALRLLDEQHLCVWSDDAPARRSVALGLTEHLQGLDSITVCTLDGSRIHDVRSFAAALGHSLGWSRQGVDVDDPDALFRLLRRARDEGATVAKRRYIIWADAHHLLNAQPRLFGRLADTLIGSALENELLDEDLLLIQRVVFIGRAALDLYSEDPQGQFRSWFSEQGEMPLWRVVTGVARPRVISVRAQSLMSPA